MTNLIKKISVKNVFGGKSEILEKVMKDKKTSHNVMRVVGVVNGFKTGETDYGPWVAARGNFQAVNTDTGETFVAPVCFLPEAGIDLIQGSMVEGESLQFAFDVGVQFSEDSATSYEYTITPLIEPAENDPVSALLASVQKSTPLALPDAKKKAKT